MKIILAATPAAGHFNPVLATGRILLAAGHEIIFTTGSAFRGQVESIGARFVPLPRYADLDLSDIDDTFPERRTLPPGLARLRFDMERIFVDTIPDQYAGLCAVLEDFPADLILGDDVFAGALPLLLGARADRPAIAALGVTFLLLHRDDGAPPSVGLPPATEAKQIAEYQHLMDATDAALFNPLRERIDRILLSLGARPLPMSFFDALVSLPDCYLHPSPPEFEYPRCDLPGSVRFIGSLPPPPGYELPREIAAVLRVGKRIVLVTQGTVANFDLGQLVAPTLTALADRNDVIVLVATGGRRVTDIPGGLPANAHAAMFLPFDLIMEHIDVLVTNGGYGTVTSALSHGVPVVVAGMTEDKPEVGARVAWSGTGIDLRTDRPTAAQLREAIDAALNDAKYRDRADAMAAAFGRHDAAHDINSLLAAAVSFRQAASKA